MEHRILSRYPLGNPHRLWRQDNFILSTFSAKGENMRGILETCADAGFNLVEIGWASHEQAEEALRLCEELELNLVYQDFSLYGGMQLRHMDREPLTQADVKAVCDHVKPYKRTAGYYVWDEPYVEDQLYEARRQVDMFQCEDPDRLPFTVAIPSYNDKYTWENGEFAAYLERYCTIIDPPMLSLDYYPIGLRWYTDEKQLDDSFMWLYIGLMRKLGRKYNMPIWFYYHGMNYTNFRRFTFPMVRMNMYAAVLYGAKGLQQFTAVGSTVTTDGQPDIFFEEQKAIHREFRMLGSTLMALENVNVIHSDDLLPGCEHMAGLAETMADSRLLCGTLPSRVSVGEFADAYGNQYLLVLNRDYETDAAVTLDLQADSRIYEVSRVTGRQNVIWDGTKQINVTLAKGDAILYRVQPAAEEAFTVEYRLEK
ncbi:MAG: hypothetical protein IJ302_06155 [Clostridia bacterium]|nr:hypothetical protein [Clostridia bacterium]